MAYQLDYKKVFNTFGPKSGKEIYGTEIGDKVINLLPNFNIHKLITYASFRVRGSTYTPFWFNEDNIWYGGEGEQTPIVRIDKKLYYIDPGEDYIAEEYSLSSIYDYDNGEDHETGWRGNNCLAIQIPLDWNTEYRLQTLTNSANGGIKSIRFYCDGQISDHQIIYADTEMDAWNITYTNPVKYIAFKTPKKEYLNAEWASGADSVAELKRCYIQIVYQGAAKRIKDDLYSSSPDLKEQDSYRIFLWESDTNTIVNEDGIICDHSTPDSILNFTFPSRIIVPMMTDEAAFAALANSDNRPLLTPVRAQKGTTTTTTTVYYAVSAKNGNNNIINQENFKNWLNFTKRELVLIPLRYHPDVNQPDIMENEKGKISYCDTLYRKLIQGSYQDPLDDLTIEYIDNAWVFPNVSATFLSKVRRYLGSDDFVNNKQYTNIAFAFGVRPKNNKRHRDSNPIKIPGALFVEQIPCIDQDPSNTEEESYYIINDNSTVGNKGNQIKLDLTPIIVKQYHITATYEVADIPQINTIQTGGTTTHPITTTYPYANNTIMRFDYDISSTPRRMFRIGQRIIQNNSEVIHSESEIHKALTCNIVDTGTHTTLIDNGTLRVAPSFSGGIVTGITTNYYQWNIDFVIEIYYRTL